MTQTLEQLSAELLPCPFCNDPMQLYGYDIIAHVNQGNCIIGQQAWEASDKNIAAWNQRTGQLVAVADDVVERVKNAVSNTPFLDFYHYHENDNQVPTTFRQFLNSTWVSDRADLILETAARSVVAALAAKGTGDE